MRQLRHKLGMEGPYTFAKKSLNQGMMSIVLEYDFKGIQSVKRAHPQLSLGRSAEQQSTSW